MIGFLVKETGLYSLLDLSEECLLKEACVGKQELSFYTEGSNFGANYAVVTAGASVL